MAGNIQIECKALGPLKTCQLKYNLVEIFWRTIWQYQLKLKMFMMIDTPFPPVGIHPTETLPEACKDTCIKRFPSALFPSVKK